MRALRATCDAVAKQYGIDIDTIVGTVRSTAREIWYASPTYEYCTRVGIASWEGLWIEYHGDDPEVEALRQWTPTYRRQAWSQALAKHGVNEDETTSRLVELFPEVRRRYHQAYPDVRHALEHLRATYRLALLTNGSVGLQNEKLDASKLRSFFETVTVSGEIGIGKPDPRVFRLVLKRLDLPSDSAVMVGDSLGSDIAGARSAGLRSIWVNRENRPNDATVAPDAEIPTLSELPTVLKILERP